MPTAARSWVGTSDDRILGQAGRAQAAHERGMDRTGGAAAVGAAAQDRRIAGLERQRPGIGGDVGTAFIDDADDAERHPHALDGHTVGPGPGFGHPADRIVQAAHHVEALGHRRDPLAAEFEPVEERARQTRSAAGGHVLRIGVEDRGRFGRGSPRPWPRAPRPSGGAARAPAPGRRVARDGRGRASGCEAHRPERWPRRPLRWISKRRHCLAGYGSGRDMLNSEI